MAPLPPGSTIGILGGGQLGRMTALAAGNLGYRCHIYDPVPDGPASQVSAATTVGGWDDTAALSAFAAAVDVVTLEFENVPVSTLELLARDVPVRPGPLALQVAQHRVEEKRFARHCGLETAPFWGVTTLDELADGLSAVGVPAILKTCRFGYDGKGQVAVDMDTSLRAAWEELGSDDAILERRIAFTCEISAIVARGLDGGCRVFPLAMNEHRDGILRRSVAPAPVDPAVARAAEAAAVALAEALELVGLLAVEFFVTGDGEVLVNEIAPRPHNSGHWTQDGCATSQFEQFVRAVVGLPLGPVDALFETEMLNLIGDDVNDWPALIADPTAKLHLYGKAEARPGRKMGHVNRRLRPWPSDRPA
ncbi:N5-carboxyaminoimidazole ribonucleotide synthase [Thalassobaculum fulvum]|uniref:N5-carboxyaminoimidazole ribonucleotide synthase n=1 Tax=Thalassobaculum fulvum TaxID=1633335 RepID=A0A919CNM7_9PROT|nr:5-(carboxyamino)imidazole ribonucleotide synthase [Thalassobaculum fulvum]GHD42922.1 N5-carboxyaminoimidazole ribonucleotide synthase [Thalassobaculum fulvum]